MRNTLTFPPIGGSQGNQTFSVVIVYEDLESGKSAKKTYDFLIEHLGDQCVFTNQMWKFDVLAMPKLREMAARDAVGADIIIVSAHGAIELPTEVKLWAEEWLAEKNHIIALVGLFDPKEYLNNPVREYLADIARRAGIEFFSQPGVWPGKEKDGKFSARDWKQNGKTFSVLSELMSQDKHNSHWGINE